METKAFGKGSVTPFAVRLPTMVFNCNVHPTYFIFYLPSPFTARSDPTGSEKQKLNLVNYLPSHPPPV